MRLRKIKNNMRHEEFSEESTNLLGYTRASLFWMLWLPENWKILKHRNNIYALTQPTFDIAGFVKNIEAAYLKMWTSYKENTNHSAIYI